MVGGRIPRWIASTLKTASTPPAAPRRCPVMDFVELTARRRTWSPKTCLTALVSMRSEEHTSELQSRLHLVCRLLLEKKNRLRIVHNGAATHDQDAFGHAD